MLNKIPNTSTNFSQFYFIFITYPKSNFVIFFVGHPGQWLCAEGPTAAAAEAHDPAPPTGGHPHPGRVAMLCVRRAFRVGGHMEDPPGGAAQSAGFVSTSLDGFIDPFCVGGASCMILKSLWGMCFAEKKCHQLLYRNDIHLDTVTNTRTLTHTHKHNLHWCV